MQLWRRLELVGSPQFGNQILFLKPEKRLCYILSSSINAAFLLSPFVCLTPFKLRCFQSFHTSQQQAEMLLITGIWHKKVRSAKDLQKCIHMHIHAHTFIHPAHLYWLFFELQGYRNSPRCLRLQTLFTDLLNKPAFGLTAEVLQALLYVVPHLLKFLKS